MADLWNIPITFVYVSSIFGYLQSRQAPKKRSLTPIIVFLLILVACSVLHFPAQSVLPHRIPEPFSAWVDYTHDDSPTRMDTLLGSYLDWTGYYDSSSTSISNAYLCFAYSWASPSLAEYFVQGRSDQKVPVPGYENVWRTGRFTVLFRGNSYVILYDTDHPEAVPIDEALAWLESWA